MGHWQSFPTLEFYDTSTSYVYEVTDTKWINAYGFAQINIQYVPPTEQSEGRLIFLLRGDGVNDYEVYYNIKKVPFTSSKAITLAEELIVETKPGNLGIDGYTYDYIYITQPKKFTMSGFNPLNWELAVSLSGVFSGMTTVDVWVQPNTTVSSSSLNISQVIEPIRLVPRIQVTFLPEGSFQDIASVTFDIEDGRNHGCTKGSYKQLISSPNSSQIPPSPLLNADFATGDLATLAVLEERSRSSSLMNTVNEGSSRMNTVNEGSSRMNTVNEGSSRMNTVNEGDVQQIHAFAPLVTCYLAGEGDFSTEKMYSINKTVGPVWPEVFLYAMAKFILNRFLNNLFDMDILYRRNTKKFLEQLSRSDYANFVDYFSQNTDKERYFLR